MQTPVLVSLVKKDAAMLDAFGKGASEDIRRTKEGLYRALTRDPATGEFHCKVASDKMTLRSLPVSPNRVRGPSSAAIPWSPTRYQSAVLVAFALARHGKDSRVLCLLI